MTDSEKIGEINERTKFIVQFVQEHKSHHEKLESSLNRRLSIMERADIVRDAHGRLWVWIGRVTAGMIGAVLIFVLQESIRRFLP